MDAFNKTYAGKTEKILLYLTVGFLITCIFVFAIIVGYNTGFDHGYDRGVVDGIDNVRILCHDTKGIDCPLNMNSG